MQVIFIIASAVLLVAAFNVVTRKNLVHSALFLIVAFLGVAVLFVLLQAGFWAVMQVLIYIGAIAILMIFAVMLTPHVTDEDGKPFNSNILIGVVTSLLTFFILVVILRGFGNLDALAPNAADAINAAVENLGFAFFDANGYLIPAMMASVLLLGGFIAALVVARPSEDEQE